MMSSEELRRHVITCLVDSQSAQQSPGWADRTLDWAEGLDRMIMIDLPQKVVTVAPDELERHGSIGALADQGLANLRAMLAGEELDVLSLSDDPDGPYCLTAESVYVASYVQLLPDLLAVAAASRRPGAPRIDGRLPNGALVSMPVRHQVVVQQLPPSDTPTPDTTVMMRRMNQMIRFTLAGYDGAPGPVSPDLYWWRPDRVDRVSTWDGESVRIAPGPELAALLGFPGER